MGVPGHASSGRGLKAGPTTSEQADLYQQPVYSVSVQQRTTSPTALCTREEPRLQDGFSKTSSKKRWQNDTKILLLAQLKKDILEALTDHFLSFVILGNAP